MNVKMGDKYPISWRVNMDLSGATVRVLTKDEHGVARILSAVITDAPGGVVAHTLDGTIPAGVYTVEVEVSRAGQVVTFPGYGYGVLTVLPDLG